MAALMRLKQMPMLHRCLWNHINKVSRSISTSKENKDSNAANAECDTKCEYPEKNWVSYGFDYKNQKEDTDAHNASFFFSVTLCLVFGSFMWAYAPDVHLRDWTQREAFLELRRRELKKEPLIDPFYIHPKKIKLPDDDDICEVEIII